MTDNDHNGDDGTRSARGHFRAVAGWTVAAAILGAVAVSFIAGRIHPDAPSAWQQLPDPANAGGVNISLQTPLGAGGGQGNGTITLNTTPASQVLAHIICHGTGVLALNNITVACTPSDTITVNEQTVTTDPRTPRIFRVLTAAKTLWRIALLPATNP